VKTFFADSGLISVTVDQYPSQVAAWLNKNRRVVNPNTLSRRLSATRDFGIFAGIPKILPDYSLPTAERPEPHPLPGLRVDLEKLIACCETDEQRCLVALLGFEGMRMHEALGVTMSDFNLDNQSIRIMGKGSKVRRVPLTNVASEYIMPGLVRAQLARPGGNIIDMPERSARYFITALGKKAKLSRPISSHDLRATFATLAYQMCKDIVLVQEWLGHADPATTAIYIGRTLDDLRKIGEI
jgi:integrase